MQHLQTRDGLLSWFVVLEHLQHGAGVYNGAEDNIKFLEDQSWEQ